MRIEDVAKIIGIVFGAPGFISNVINVYRNWNKRTEELLNNITAQGSYINILDKNNPNKESAERLLQDQLEMQIVYSSFGIYASGANAKLLYDFYDYCNVRKSSNSTVSIKLTDIKKASPYILFDGNKVAFKMGSETSFVYNANTVVFWCFFGSVGANLLAWIYGQIDAIILRAEVPIINSAFIATLLSLALQFYSAFVRSDYIKINKVRKGIEEFNAFLLSNSPG